MKRRKIIIIRLSAIGDTIHSLPLVAALKKQDPGLFIGWVVEKKALAFVQQNPVVDKVYILEKKNLSGYIKVINEIRKDNYDVAIDIQGLLKSAILMFFSGAKRRIAFDRSREFSYLLANERIDAGEEFDTDTHVIDRNLLVAKHLGYSVDNIDFPLPECDVDIWQKFLSGFDKSKPLICLSPATTWDTKHWSEKSWAKVLDGLNENQVVFTGGPNDVELIDKIISMSSNKNAKILAGKTNLLELAKVFENSSVVVTPDSGSAHIAVATKNPRVICLLGPTSEKRNGAYVLGVDGHINMITNVNCRPCYKKKCPKTGNIKECILSISDELVLKNINKILNKNFNKS